LPWLLPDPDAVRFAFGRKQGVFLNRGNVFFHLRTAVQNNIQDRVKVVRRDEFQGFSDALVDLLKIRLVVCGITTVEIPARRAAIVFSFSPPMAGCAPEA
jgi:hypothetical protein